MTAPPLSGEPAADQPPVRYGIRFLLALTVALLTALTAALTGYAYLALDRLQARMETLAEGSLMEITLAHRLQDSTETLLRPILLMAELPTEAPITATLNGVGMQIRDVRADADLLAARLKKFGSTADRARMAAVEQSLQETEGAIRDFAAAAGQHALAQSRRGELTARLETRFDRHFETATPVENRMRSMVSRRLALDLPAAAERDQLESRLDVFLAREMNWLAIAQNFRSDARELHSLMRAMSREKQGERLPASQKALEAQAQRLLAWRRLPAGEEVRALGRATDTLLALLAAPPALAQLRADELTAEAAVAASAKNTAGTATRFAVQTRDLVRQLSQDIREHILQTRAEVQQAQAVLTIAAILAALACILLIYVAVTRRVIHPLERITLAMRRAAAALSRDNPDWQLALAPVSTSDNDEVAAMYRALHVFRDTLVQREEELEYLAHHDPLTGLPNRALLEDRLEHAIVHADRHGSLLAVCYLDLDGFKPVNDRYGHAAGDALLKEIAQRLKANLRGADTVARLGGDEFVLLLCELDDVEECRHTLERVLASIGSPCILGSDPQIHACVTASIGVTLYPMDKTDSNALLRHADHAMYLAKQRGKNAFHLFQGDAGGTCPSNSLH